MSFSNMSESLAKELIQSELKHAVALWGDKYNSNKEAYIVLEEEIREAEFEKIQLDKKLYEFYKYVFYGESLPTHFFDVAEQIIMNEIKELAQVGAVLQKIKNTLEVEE